MIATEELRHMLDERGVEYETNDTQVSDTEWYYVTKLRDGYHDRWTYEEPPDCDLLVSYQYDLGAEDAIDATLGQGTCHNAMPLLPSGMPYPDSWMCSECGGRMDGIILEIGNYCPNCGRKVVGE